MNYSEARSKIKSGDVLAWTHKKARTLYDLRVQLVRFFTRSEYTHVGMAWVIGGRVFILESVATGIRIFPLSRELPFFWIPIDIDFSDDVLNAALAHLGEPYSNLEGVMSLFKNITPGENQQWECAEFVRFLLKKANIKCDCKNTPTEIVSWLQHNHNAAVYTVLADDINTQTT